MRNLEYIGLSAIIIATLGLSSCGPRKQLTRSHGESVRAFSKIQTVNPTPKKDSVDKLGLDSQEAAAVAATYRKSLSPQTATEQQGPILFVDPKSGKTEALQPSVPKDKR